MNAEHVRAQLDRILASEAFGGAGHASRFLRFVVERTLDGHAHEIKEAVIAIEVLGRKPSFDSKSDPIVRVEAGRLRERLASYYADEGDADTVVIDLPKGRYIPEFAERELPVHSVRADFLRLTILPPDGVPFNSFTVSPDGRHLAFTAALGGTQMLWVRALDALDARPLVGTEQAEYPFWSPDSRTIGFFTPNRLKRIDLSGGPPSDIANIVIGIGASWGAQDVIVFADRPSVGTLHQVPATGGPITPVSSLDASRDECAHVFPQFLPDGQHFIYLARSSRTGVSSIRVGSLDASRDRPLVESDTTALYASILLGRPSVLLFVSGGALLAQPFDVERLELRGERSVVLPQVRYRRWHLAQFTISGDGILLYQSGSVEHHQFSWFDRQGTMLATVGPLNDYMTFSLSPDERYVAFYRNDDPATGWPKVWVMDLARDGALFRFAESEIPEAEFCPVWSPDGRELLFSRGHEGRMRLWRRPLNGGTATCVLDSEGPKFPSDWSRDGRLVAFSSQVPDYRYLHVWITSADPSVAVETSSPLPHGYIEPSTSASACFFPGADPDGSRWIAYMSAETGREEVYVRECPAGVRKWQVSSAGGRMPRWRADGRELFYLSLDGTLMAAPVGVDVTPEVGMPSALFATGLRFIPQFKTWTNQYAPSLDGQRFLINAPARETAADSITVIVPK